MAGHFVLKSITVSDLQVAIMRGCAWSPLQHAGGTIGGGGVAFGGWNAATRANLTLALNVGLGPGGNRNMLPPHRYLTFGPFRGGIPPDPVRTYILGAGWAEQVERPIMGLTALNPAATANWPGNPAAAVLAQADHGATSIEVYFVGGTEMS